MPKSLQAGFVSTVAIPVILLIILAGAGVLLVKNQTTVSKIANQESKTKQLESSTSAKKIEVTLPSSQSAELKAWKTYTDNKTGFSIDYPHNWHHQDGMKFHEQKYLISSEFFNDNPQMDKYKRKVEMNVYPQSLDEVKKILAFQSDLLKVETKVTDTEIKGRKALKSELISIKVTSPKPSEDMGASNLVKQLMDDPNKLNYFVSISEKITLEVSFGKESQQIVDKMLQSITFSE